MEYKIRENGFKKGDPFLNAVEWNGLVEFIRSTGGELKYMRTVAKDYIMTASDINTVFYNLTLSYNPDATPQRVNEGDLISAHIFNLL